MTSTLFKNALVLDTEAGTILGERDVLIESGRIKEVSETSLTAEDARVVDLAGAVLMPGLCDAHVHVTVATPNFAELRRWSPYYVTARASKILGDMINRGFTTVRDAGGADYGLALAVEEGYLVGPRILYSGKALSQTGGHGDVRGRGENDTGDCYCRPGLGRICNGVAEVRQAARDEIRKGAHQIKIMIAGGVSSPTDPVVNNQFSLDEITASVEEAANGHTYVMAHAYTGESIRRGLECGVRSFEHGNLLDPGTAAMMADKAAFLVPTMATYVALARDGIAAGLPAELHAKIGNLQEKGIESIEMAYRAGVKIVYGTDLLGDLHWHQTSEFATRAEVQTNSEVIQSATVTAADLFNMEGDIGVVAPGARADLIVVDGNPLDDLGLLQGQGEHLKAVMKDGAILVDRLR
jgi:imidazolonepropionase-like amidohydrolase